MDNKEYFIEKLKATGRKGIDTVVERLDGLGFFQAPASTGQHHYSSPTARCVQG